MSRATISPKRVLGLFAKHPEPGYVKTRLAAEVSAEWAARVAAAFLLDTLKRLEAISVDRVVAFAPSQARAFFEEAVQGSYRLVEQSAGDLGQRMSGFLADAFLEGASSVVLVGCDSPTVPPSFVEQAFAELEQAELVLGPAMDGGYYLVGCGRSAPPIFANIPWGTSHVLRDTMVQVQKAGLRLALLPPWYDVDTLDDWRMLQGHVLAQRHAGVEPGIPNTEKLLADCQDEL